NCLVYSKNKTALTITRVDKVEETLRNLNDAPTSLDTRPDMGYTIYYNPLTKGIIPKHDYNKANIHLNDENLVYVNDQELIRAGYIPVRPGTRNGKLHRWRWGINTFLKRIEEIEFEEIKDGYSVSFKQSGFNAPKNVLNFGSGTAEVKELFDGTKLFDFPKGIKFLSRLVNIGTESDSIILDFFAGSGSTAHAVLKTNAEDGGKRKHISVQLPEPTDKKSEAYKFGFANIAEISKERIRRSAKKIQEEYPDFDGDLGFKVFKLDSSNIKRWEANFDTLEADLINAVDYIKQDRTNEDILFELLLKYGLKLTVPIETRTIEGKTVYSIGLGALVVCLDEDISMDAVNGIGALKEELKPEIMRVVFKDDCFEDDVVKTNALQTLKRYGIDDIKSF
ncbi:MAG: DNA methyltransferase, partial [Paracoccaceae bacterium]|nr:DNA methyltransferase [Paracoccaceae bacterium]